MLDAMAINVNSVDMDEKKLKYHHGDLADDISKIAWEKVHVSGADKLSLRSCARDAGVDPAAVYRHFKSKEDLLGHLANRAFAELSTAMDKAKTNPRGTDPSEALVQIGLAYIRYAKSGDAHLTGASPEGSAAYEILVRGITELNPKTDINIHIFTLWSMVHGFSKLVNAGLGPGTAQIDQMSRNICENIVATIR